MAAVVPIPSRRPRPSQTPGPALRQILRRFAADLPPFLRQTFRRFCGRPSAVSAAVSPPVFRGGTASCCLYRGLSYHRRAVFVNKTGGRAGKFGGIPQNSAGLEWASNDKPDGEPRPRRPSILPPRRPPPFTCVACRPSPAAPAALHLWFPRPSPVAPAVLLPAVPAVLPWRPPSFACGSRCPSPAAPAPFFRCSCRYDTKKYHLFPGIYLQIPKIVVRWNQLNRAKTGAQI